MRIPRFFQAIISVIALSNNAWKRFCFMTFSLRCPTLLIRINPAYKVHLWAFCMRECKLLRLKITQPSFRFAYLSHNPGKIFGRQTAKTDYAHKMYNFFLHMRGISPAISISICHLSFKFISALILDIAIDFGYIESLNCILIII